MLKSRFGTTPTCLGKPLRGHLGNAMMHDGVSSHCEPLDSGVRENFRWDLLWASLGAVGRRFSSMHLVHEPKSLPASFLCKFEVYGTMLYWE